MRAQATKIVRGFPVPFDTTAQTLAHLRADIEQVARRGTVRELGPGHLIIRVPVWKIRAMRRHLEPRKLVTVRYDVRAISLREHWTLKRAIVILNWRRRVAEGIQAAKAGE